MAKKTMSQLVVEVQADVARLKKDMGQMKREVNTFTDGASKAFKALGATIALAFSAVAIKRGIEESLTRFMDYESAVSRIGNVTDESLGQVAEKLKSIAPEYGTLTELAQGYYNVMSAGITDETAAMDMLLTSAGMAKEAHIAQADAVRGLASLMSSYSTELTKASDAADLLYQIEASGITTVQELIPHIGSLANQAAALGLSANEMAAAMAQISKAGQGTSEAATQLQSVMTGLIKPTTEMTKLLEEYGGAQAAIKMLGFEGVLRLIAEKTQMNAEALGELFGRKEALLAFFQLAKNNFQGFGEALDAMNEKTGKFNAAWDRFKNTLAGIWDTFKNSVGNILIEIGEKMAPMVKELLVDFGGWLNQMKDPIINEFGEWMEKLLNAYRSIRDYIAAVVSDLEAWVSGSEAVMKTGLVAWLKNDLVKGINNAIDAIQDLARGLGKIVGWCEAIIDKAGAAAKAIKKFADFVTNPGKAIQEMTVSFFGEGSTKKPITEKIAEIQGDLTGLQDTASQDVSSTTQFLADTGLGSAPMTHALDQIESDAERLKSTLESPMKMNVDTSAAESAIDSLKSKFMELIQAQILTMAFSKGDVVKGAHKEIMLLMAAWQKAQGYVAKYLGKGFQGGGYTGETGGFVHPREFVLPAEAVQYYGLGLLQQMQHKLLDREKVGAGQAGAGSASGGASPIRITTGKAAGGGANIHISSQYMNSNSLDARRMAEMIQDELRRLDRRSGAVRYAM